MTISPAPPTDQIPSTPGVLYCANHPSVETGLRCNNCNKPICAKCAKRMPTGYRCKECISGQQRVFDTSQWYDYPLAFTIAGLLSLAASFLVSLIGFFTIFLAPIIGVGIAEAVRFATGRRRSPHLFLTAGIATALGSLPLMLYTFVTLLFLGFGRGGLLDMLWLGLYAFTATSTVYYRMRGITMK